MNRFPVPDLHSLSSIKDSDSSESESGKISNIGSLMTEDQALDGLPP